MFVTQFIRNFREIRLRVRNQQIFRLRPVDGVAKAPATNRFDTFAVAALRPLGREASSALSAGRDCAYEHAITDRTRAIVTISPNNPSGAVLSEASLVAVNDLCRSRGLYHVADEPYEYFTYG